MKKNELEEIYKKPNSLTRAFYKTSVLGQKLFCYSLFCATNKDKIEDMINFSIVDFAKALNVSRSGQGYKNIKKAIQEIYEFNIKVKDDDNNQELDMFRVFQEVKIEKNAISLLFSKRATEILKKYQKKQYTLLTLNQIAKLKSFYAIRLYEIALSWSGQRGKIKGKPKQWFFEFSFEEFKEIFQLEEMRSDNVVSRVIKKPTEEINEVTNIIIEYELEQEKKHPPKKVRFWCSFKENEQISIINLFDQSNQNLKKEISDDEQEYENAMKYKKLHTKEWDEKEKEVRMKLDKLYGISTMQILVDIETFKELKNSTLPF